jgi:hypothetical protein
MHWGKRAPSAFDSCDEIGGHVGIGACFETSITARLAEHLVIAFDLIGIA